MSVVNEVRIFKRGSTTFFWSSLLFPRNVRRDIFDLYSFVRVADDYVDEQPQNPEAFYELRNLWQDAIKSVQYDTSKLPSDSTNLRVVKNMFRLSHEHNFDPKWVDDFLNVMESDLHWTASTTNKKSPKQKTGNRAPKSYKFNNPKSLLFYIHGSSETVGLMMARIMKLPKAADRHAKLLARSLQTINFIRDINYDNHLGRCYFGNRDFEQFGLLDLSEETARANPEAFTRFVSQQISSYRKNQQEASRGYKYIPWRYLTAIRTAADLYEWTAREIDKNPLIVFQKQVKPTKLRILKTALSNIFKPHNSQPQTYRKRG